MRGWVNDGGGEETEGRKMRTQGKGGGEGAGQRGEGPRVYRLDRRVAMETYPSAQESRFHPISSLRTASLLFPPSSFVPRRMS